MALIGAFSIVDRKNAQTLGKGQSENVTQEHADPRPSARAGEHRGDALRDSQGRLYDAGITHLELGERLNDLAHLEQAETILSQIGAKLDWERARLLLDQMA